MTDASRLSLLRRLAAWMRSKRLDPVGKELLAEVETATKENRGRPPKLTSAEARELIRQHGTAEAAARAIGSVSGETIRRKAKAESATSR